MSLHTETKTNPINLDFSPLTSPVTNEDIRAMNSSSSSSWSKRWINPVLATVLVMVVGVFIAIVFLGGPSSLVSMILPMLIGIFIIGGIVWMVWYGLKLQKVRLIRFNRFAQRNGLEFIHDKANPAYAGMIFDEGHSRELNESLIFPDRLEIGNYTYVTGSGRNARAHQYGFLRIPLTRRLPHMVLDAKKNNFLGISNLSDTFNRSQVLSLEGDFDRYFTLYAPKEYERDALYIFTPDVMLALIEDGGAYDMEVIDDNLFIYHVTKFDLMSEQKIRTLLAIAERIGSEIKDQSGYYADERVGDRVQNIVAAPGARLKHGVNWVMVVAIIVAVIFYTADIWGSLISQR